MPDDTADQCCAAGICCNHAKRRAALAKMLREHDSRLSERESTTAADFIHDTFDIVPKTLHLHDFLERYATMAREHPYT